MQRVDLSRKGPSRWPFLAGLVVFAVIAIGVTHLLRAEPEPAPPVPQPTPADSLPPAAIPAPPNDPDAAALLTALAPLDRRDVGRRVRASGTVVATDSAGFWLLVDGRVIQVESSRRAKTGDSLDVAGRLSESAGDPAPAGARDEVLAGNPDSDGWEIVDRVKVVESGAGREP